MKGFLPSFDFIYFLCLRTKKATASNPAIAKIASKPGSVFVVVVTAAVVATAAAVSVTGGVVSVHPLKDTASSSPQIMIARTPAFKLLVFTLPMIITSFPTFSERRSKFVSHPLFNYFFIYIRFIKNFSHKSRFL